jgi:hypothetical protein
LSIVIQKWQEKANCQYVEDKKLFIEEQ